MYDEKETFSDMSPMMHNLEWYCRWTLFIQQNTVLTCTVCDS